MNDAALDALAIVLVLAPVLFFAVVLVLGMNGGAL